MAHANIARCNDQRILLHFWGVATRDVPAAMVRMATDRAHLRRLPGLQFYKLMGTGSGSSFSIRQADLHHWAVLTVWPTQQAAIRYEQSEVVRKWQALAYESLRCELRTIHSRGQWSGRAPFTQPASGVVSGPVASLTRARIKVSQWARFARAVPPVAYSVGQAQGLVMRTGIGEAPIGLQGTFSIWQSNDAVNKFTYDSAHQKAIDDTTRIGWYAEELFTRFSVVSAYGNFAGQPIKLGTQ